MHGLINATLQFFVEDVYGPDRLASVIRRAGLNDTLKNEYAGFFKLLMPWVRDTSYVVAVAEDEKRNQGNHCMFYSMNSSHEMMPALFSFTLEPFRYFKPESFCFEHLRWQVQRDVSDYLLAAEQVFTIS